MQLFIEPKGEKWYKDDKWKQDFLAQLKAQARLETVFRGRVDIVLGLPFFNEEGQINADFRVTFEGEALTK